MAERTPHAEVRQDLIAMSLRYEHLAARAKAIAEKAHSWLHPSDEQNKPSIDADREAQPK